MHFPVFEGVNRTNNDFLLLGRITLRSKSLIEKTHTSVELVQLFNLKEMCVCVIVYLSAYPAQPCCGDDSCVFPACHGGHVGERRAGVEAEASAGPVCGGSEACGLPDGTLEETPH